MNDMALTETMAETMTETMQATVKDTAQKLTGSRRRAFMAQVAEDDLQTTVASV
ncbi:MAG: hypothetical protein AB4042_20010 [Leptolyngbyaceae cyanobacterium]